MKQSCNAGLNFYENQNVATCETVSLAALLYKMHTSIQYWLYTFCTGNATDATMFDESVYVFVKVCPGNAVRWDNECNINYQQQKIAVINAPLAVRDTRTKIRSGNDNHHSAFEYFYARVKSSTAGDAISHTVARRVLLEQRPVSLSQTGHVKGPSYYAGFNSKQFSVSLLLHS